MTPAAKEAQERLWALLGDLPARDRPIGYVSHATGEVRLPGALVQLDDFAVSTSSSYQRFELLLDLNGVDPVPVTIVKPKSFSGKLPVVIYNHAHGGDYDHGRREFLEGREQIQDPPYAEVCAQNGWLGVCIDTWNFGERHTGPESQVFKEMLWRGQVLWGLMVYDSIRLVDFLCSLPEVDAARIATVGLSMGSTMSWWMAALDERIKVCVDICCLTDFEELIRDRGLDRHGMYYYVPGLLKHFTTAQINALIAPRAHLALAGLRDPLTPVHGLERIDSELKEVYAREGAPGNWKLFTQDTGHNETREMRDEIVGWLTRHL